MSCFSSNLLVFFQEMTGLSCNVLILFSNVLIHFCTGKWTSTVEPIWLDPKNLPHNKTCLLYKGLWTWFITHPLVSRTKPSPSQQTIYIFTPVDVDIDVDTYSMYACIGCIYVPYCISCFIYVAVSLWVHMNRFGFSQFVQKRSKIWKNL